MTGDSQPKFKPLSNSNYNDWSGEMKAWLMRNKLWRLVCEKEKKPSSTKTEELALWEAKAEQAAGEIYLCVEPSQRVHFRGHEEDPIEMWKRLERHHLSKKPGARFNAYDELFSITKEEGESLVDLGTRVENAMANIKNLRSATMTIEQLDEELSAMALIRALPKEYSHLSMSLLLLDKLDKDVVMEAFRSEELNQKRVEGANFARASGRRKEGPYHPYRGDMKDATCFTCGNKGHMRNECPNPRTHRKAGTEGANKAKEKAEAVIEFAGKASAVSEEEALSTSANIFHWNTDTGATSHMTPHRDWIRNYTPYRVPIQLADSRIIYSESYGIVVFRPIINGKQSRDIELSRVLHVHLLQSNLLAVLYLTQHKEFEVLISKKSMKFMQRSKLLFTATVDDN